MHITDVGLVAWLFWGREENKSFPTCVLEPLRFLRCFVPLLVFTIRYILFSFSPASVPFCVFPFHSSKWTRATFPEQSLGFLAFPRNEATGSAVGTSPAVYINWLVNTLWQLQKLKFVVHQCTLTINLPQSERKKKTSASLHTDAEKQLLSLWINALQLTRIVLNNEASIIIIYMPMST